MNIIRRGFSFLLVQTFTAPIQIQCKHMKYSIFKVDSKYRGWIQLSPAQIQSKMRYSLAHSILQMNFVHAGKQHHLEAKDIYFPVVIHIYLAFVTIYYNSHWKTKNENFGHLEGCRQWTQAFTVEYKITISNISIKNISK